MEGSATRGYPGRHGFGSCLELCQVAVAVRCGYLGGGWGSTRQLERQFNSRHTGKRITNRRHAAVVLGMAGFVVRKWRYQYVSQRCRHAGSVTFAAGHPPADCEW